VNAAVSISYCPAEGAGDPAKFWMEIDERLEDLGQGHALWTEELSAPYAAGMSIDQTMRIVLARRMVSP